MQKMRISRETILLTKLKTPENSVPAKDGLQHAEDVQHPLMNEPSRHRKVACIT